MATTTHGQDMEDNRLSEEVIQTVIASIARVKKIEPGTVQLDSTFEDLRMDSLDGLDLFFELEEAFDITIPDNRARSIRTVGCIVDEIQRLLVERKETA